MENTIRENGKALSCTGQDRISYPLPPCLLHRLQVCFEYNFRMPCATRTTEEEKTECIGTDKIELMKEHQYPEGGGVWTPIVFPFSLFVSGLSAICKD